MAQLDDDDVDERARHDAATASVRYMALLAHLDELMAYYLKANPKRSPSTTTILDLIQWTYVQAQRELENSR